MLFIYRAINNFKIRFGLTVEVADYPGSIIIFIILVNPLIICIDNLQQKIFFYLWSESAFYFANVLKLFSDWNQVRHIRFKQKYMKI